MEVSTLISSLCGRIESGRTRAFVFSNAGTIEVKETSFAEGEIGFKTWDGGIVMAKMIDLGEISCYNQDILELGSGTGIVGLLAGKAGAKSVTMSDFNPVVIANSVENIMLNDLSNVKCIALDWRWFEDLNISTNLPKSKWKIILAADCIFDISHSRFSIFLIRPG